jgi:cytochrome c biogenesis protein CcdA
MYLVTIDHPRRRLSEFLTGVFAVNLLGGLILMLGPGQLLLSLVPKPDPTTKHIIELVAGVALIVIAVLLWTGREALGRRKPPVFKGNRRSGVILGAGIAAVELPTALPYFAAIAVIVGSDAAIPGQIGALIVYNAAFLAPIGAMLLTLMILGDAATQPLARVNHWVLGHWPTLLAGLASLVGVCIFVLGLAGLLSL